MVEFNPSIDISLTVISNRWTSKTNTTKQTQKTITQKYKWTRNGGSWPRKNQKVFKVSVLVLDTNKSLLANIYIHIYRLCSSFRSLRCMRPAMVPLHSQLVVVLGGDSQLSQIPPSDSFDLCDAACSIFR